MGESDRVEAAPGHPDVIRVLAPNPGPMTLSGTNTYLVSEDEGVWVVDPGPRIESHLVAIRTEAESRGGIRGVLLTHSHSDHSEAAADLGAPVVLGQVGGSDERQVFAGDRGGSTPTGGSAEPTATVGSLEIVPTPGHAADHVALVVGSACLCGDLILGEGSSIVPPRAHGGSLTDYLASLERLASLGIDLLAPGHGPWISDPQAKIADYIAHRREREAKLVAALDAGERTRERLLDLAWDDVPELMRPAAAVALQAHLEKLADENRLPPIFKRAGPL